MRKLKTVLAVGCAAALLVSCAACGEEAQGDAIAVPVTIQQVEKLVESGQLEEAYAALQTLTGEQADAWREKLVFVPVSTTEVAADGTRTPLQTYTYDSRGWLVEHTSPTQNTWASYTYRDEGVLLSYSRTFEQGVWEQVKTDAYYLGSPCTYTYTDSTGRKRTQTYDKDGVLVEEKYTKDGVTTTITFDPKKNLWFETIVDGEQEKRFTYNEKDIMINSTTIKDGLTESIEYVEIGGEMLKKSTSIGDDLYQRKTEYTYTETGAPLTINQTDSADNWETTTYTYNEQGHLLTKRYKTSTGKFRNETCVYDNDVLLETDYEDSSNRWKRTTLERDANGNLLGYETTDSDGNWKDVVITYDAENHRLSQDVTTSDFDWEKFTYTYTEQGYRLTEDRIKKDGSWERTKYTYDDQGHCIGEEWVDTTGNRQIITYSATGATLSLETVRASGEREKTTWDEAGNKVAGEYASPDGSFSKETYDETGAILTGERTWSNGEWLKVTADDRQYVEETGKKDGSWVKETTLYNEKGERTSWERVTSDGKKATTTYTYDDQGHLLVTEMVAEDGTTSREVCTYDRFGNLTKLESLNQTDPMTVEYVWKLVYYPKGQPRITFENDFLALSVEKNIVS